MLPSCDHVFKEIWPEIARRCTKCKSFEWKSFCLATENDPLGGWRPIWQLNQWDHRYRYGSESHWPRHEGCDRLTGGKIAPIVSDAFWNKHTGMV